MANFFESFPYKPYKSLYYAPLPDVFIFSKRSLKELGMPVAKRTASCASYIQNLNQTQSPLLSQKYSTSGEFVALARHAILTTNEGKESVKKP